MHRIRLAAAAIVLSTAFAGCDQPGNPAGSTPEPTRQPTAILTTPASTSEPLPDAQPTTSFEAATYRDEVAGFELDYPASWTVGPVEQYSRGGITAFTSWARPTDVLPSETPPGETRLDVTVQAWEPVRDLEAFLAQRREAWLASGNVIARESSWTTSDGWPAAEFIVVDAGGAEAYFFFTTVGDRYLVLSGSGDLGLLGEIANSVRPVPFSY